MSDLVLRGLDDHLKQSLRERAAQHGRSMNAELKEILREALEWPQQNPHEEFLRLAAISRAMTAGTPQTPSEILVRESRDADAR